MTKAKLNQNNALPKQSITKSKALRKQSMTGATREQNAL
jgi:hypothetical protein